MVKGHASGVLDIFFMKSYTKGHRMHKLDSWDDSALDLVESELAAQPRISCKIYLESLNHALSPY